METFATYTCALEELALEAAADNANSGSAESIRAALDGGPGMALRAVTPLDVMRANGAFFTGSDLANRLISSIEPQLAQGAVVSDLACGTGNLLTACAYHLPMGDDLPQTLEIWGQYLCGTDIHDEFIRAAKARLALVALDRGATCGSQVVLEDSFPQIRLGDAFEQTEMISQADCITLNPPFTINTAPPDCAWAQGAVSTAALMLETCVLKAKAGAIVVAILPEVLRTGSHYLRWRKAIERIAKIESVEVIGSFDVWTDVDVFILRLTVGASVGESAGNWWKSDDKFRTQNNRLGELFEVRVGAVVPHRDPQLGNWHAFIHAKDLPVWKSVNIDSGFPCRRFAGTTHIPPFVVVRRTSRPGDNYRAVATVIRGKRTVAVENHLLVLKPRDGSLRICLEAMKKLQSSDTNVWLNERIRCRHLTVSSIGEMPWWKQ